MAMRAAELAGAQAFLSTTGRLSDAEVLGIVRDVSENIYQTAVKLAEEWEILESSRSWLPSIPFTNAYPHPVSIALSVPTGSGSHITEGQAISARMEVIDPQLHLPTAVSLHVVSGAVDEPH